MRVKHFKFYTGLEKYVKFQGIYILVTINIELEEVKRQPNVKCIKLCSILPESETQRALNLFLVHVGN